MEDVKVNLDISHWVVCLERFFGSKESLMKNGPEIEWYPDVVDLLNHHCKMIHARVGFPQGIQVPDLNAPEYALAVKSHMMYWEAIMKHIHVTGQTLYVTPEHGPWPYQHSLPNTNMKPTTDIWEANNHVARMISDLWKSVAGIKKEVKANE